MIVPTSTRSLATMVDDMNALPDERQQLILHRLSQEGRALASELARAFHTSEDTIRRDLREMAAAGLCRRVYGGALPLSPASGTLAEREVEMPERKIAWVEPWRAWWVRSYGPARCCFSTLGPPTLPSRAPCLRASASRLSPMRLTSR